MITHWSVEVDWFVSHVLILNNSQQLSVACEAMEWEIVGCSRRLLFSEACMTCLSTSESTSCKQESVSWYHRLFLSFWKIWSRNYALLTGTSRMQPTSIISSLNIIKFNHLSWCSSRHEAGFVCYQTIIGTINKIPGSSFAGFARMY